MDHRVILKSLPVLSTVLQLHNWHSAENYRFLGQAITENDTSYILLAVRLSIDSDDGRFLHVWFMIDSVDGTGRTNSFTKIDYQ